MALWFDVDDLVRYFGFNARPTGIQRLSLVLFRELQAMALSGTPILFCRRQATAPFFQPVDFPALEARLSALIEAPPAMAARPKPAWRLPKPGWRRHLPLRQRASLGRIARALRELASAGRDLLTLPASHGHVAGAHQFDLPGRVTFAPGDWLINLGSSWNAPYQPAALAHLQGSGVRFAVTVCDLIPELFPEWSAADTLREFRTWMSDTLPAADFLFAISRNTEADLRRFFSQNAMPIPPVKTLPMGGARHMKTVVTPPPLRPFVLFVSTIEVRKNHALMFRVWKQLLARHPDAQIPDLVFAGKPGWLTNDLRSQFENANWLGGKIRFCESPTDAELSRLYQQCMFTVYPSLYEGWGLPVSESLSFGKTVAASNRASIREAGGDFCTYFDPENLTEATDIIGGLIGAPERIAALERHIAQNYNPPGWGDVATVLVEAIAQYQTLPPCEQLEGQIPMPSC
ncbi:MAG: hypothetical protein B7Z81_11875 [Acidocella sp. 20-61-6]|nr:MAG: hypothetical protein B7Z81_11875 [Acidocella sp. 20-61-6]